MKNLIPNTYSTGGQWIYDIYEEKFKNAQKYGYTPTTYKGSIVKNLDDSNSNNKEFILFSCERFVKGDCFMIKNSNGIEFCIYKKIDNNTYHCIMDKKFDIKDLLNREIDLYFMPNYNFFEAELIRKYCIDSYLKSAYNTI